MARLLDDASLLAGKEFKMGNFADIIEAIHVIQESMGITGTTAQEASETINGSISSWKSALDNLLTGIGRNENIDQLVDNLVASTEDVIANLVPAIRRASEGFMQVMRVAVVRIGPQVLDAFRDIWNNKLPGMLTSAANGIIGLINDVFGTNIPKIETIELPSWGDISAKVILWAETVRNRIRTIAKWSIGIFTEPTETATEMKTTFTTWWEETAKPAILSISTWTLNLFGMPEADENTIKAHVGAWWEGIVTWVQNACVWTLQIFGFAPDAAEKAVLAVKQWFAGVIKTIGGALKLVFNWASGMDAATLADQAETIFEDAKTLIGQALEFAWSLVPGPIQEKLQPLVDSISDFWTTNEETILGLIKGLTEVYNMISGVVVGMFSDTLTDEELWASVGGFLTSTVDAVKQVATALAPVGEQTFGTVLSSISKVLDTISPLLGDVAQFFTTVTSSLAGMFNDALSDEELWASLGSTLGAFMEAINGIAEALAPVAEATFGTILQAIKTALYLIEPILNSVDGILGLLEIPLSIISGVIEDIAWFLRQLTGGDPEEKAALAAAEAASKIQTEERMERAGRADYGYAEVQRVGDMLSRKSMAGESMGIEEWLEGNRGRAEKPATPDIYLELEEFWDYYREAKIGHNAFDAENYVHDLWSALMDHAYAGGMEGIDANTYTNAILDTYLRGLMNLDPNIANIPLAFYKEEEEELGGGGGGKPGARTEDVVTELEIVKSELQGLRADLIAAVNSLANRPIAVNGKIITDIVGQGILRKARATFG